MRITAKGQVTIPIEIREKLGLYPNTELECELAGDSVMMWRAKGKRVGRGRAIVEHVRGRGSVRMSTDEILALTRSSRPRARRSP
jgi:AbrB family looped-hinge helix DNA binding protein